MVGRRRDVLTTVGLILIYLAGMSTLALMVDRRFFLNDAIAAAVFGLIVLMLAASGTFAAVTRRD